MDNKLVDSNNLLQTLYSTITPPQFEQLIGKLLEEMGFQDVDVTGQSGDKGVDLQATWNQQEVNNISVLDFDPIFLKSELLPVPCIGNNLL